MHVNRIHFKGIRRQESKQVQDKKNTFSIFNSFDTVVNSIYNTAKKRPFLSTSKFHPYRPAFWTGRGNQTQPYSCLFIPQYPTEPLEFICVLPCFPFRSAYIRLCPFKLCAHPFAWCSSHVLIPGWMHYLLDVKAYIANFKCQCDVFA